MTKKKRIMIYSIITSLFVTTAYSYEEKKSSSYEREVESHSLSCEDKKYHVTAHRGFSSINIENTKSAITSCNNINCIDGIEIDVRFTKDEVPILFHNKKINGEEIKKRTFSQIEKDRITNPFCFEDYFLSYIEPEMGYGKRKRFLLVKEKEESILSLEEALNLIKPTKTLLVDIKFEEDGNRNESMIKKIGDLLKNSNFSNSIIQSTDAFSLKRMKEKYPFFSYQLIVKEKTDLESYYPYFDSFALKETMVTKKIIKDLKENDKKIAIWTVNDYQTLFKIEKEVYPYEEDINYITDYPDFICYALQKKKK